SYLFPIYVAAPAPHPLSLHDALPSLAAHPLRPLGMGEIRIEGGFWGERQRLNGTSIIPHCLHWEERVGWVNNFSALLRGTLAERSEEHTSELQSRENLVCRLLLVKKK